jgi:hypothetical protein
VRGELEIANYEWKIPWFASPCGENQGEYLRILERPSVAAHPRVEREDAILGGEGDFD